MNENWKLMLKLSKNSIITLNSLTLYFQQILASYSHGVKRSGSYSRDFQNYKVSKHKHQTGFGYQKENFSANINHMSNSSKPVNIHNQPANMTFNSTMYQPGVSLKLYIIL